MGAASDVVVFVHCLARMCGVSVIGFCGRTDVVRLNLRVTLGWLGGLTAISAQDLTASLCTSSTSSVSLSFPGTSSMRCQSFRDSSKISENTQSGLVLYHGCSSGGTFGTQGLISCLLQAAQAHGILRIVVRPRPSLGSALKLYINLRLWPWLSLVLYHGVHTMENSVRYFLVHTFPFVDVSPIFEQRSQEVEPSTRSPCLLHFVALQ